MAVRVAAFLPRASQRLRRKTEPSPATHAKKTRPVPQKTSRDLSPPAVSKEIQRPGESPFLPAESQSKPSPRVTPIASTAKKYRPSDARPKHNVAALKAVGIHRYASKHLELFTDIKPELAKDLPPLVDQLYAALENYFGPLPPDREGSTFQMTGYIMADKRVFRETGLLPENLPGFYHGRNRGAEFWINDQEYDYFRRHLMLHEATHCYMTFGKTSTQTAAGVVHGRHGGILRHAFPRKRRQGRRSARCRTTPKITPVGADLAHPNRREGRPVSFAGPGAGTEPQRLRRKRSLRQGSLRLGLGDLQISGYTPPLSGGFSQTRPSPNPADFSSAILGRLS